MKYLLDTCVITDFIKNQKETVRRIKELKPNELCISVITEFEIKYGIERVIGTKQGRYIAEASNSIISVMEVLEFSREIAELAAKVRAKLSNLGTPIGAYDLLIAATAKYYDLTVVTSNIREFERVEDLKIENFRK
ncbi:MAG: PIN domain-containing protein [Rickettsiales bacterium]|jgi:tRNA(fMet)-specific endonuclease VapC|nr:PIN domain-containing protein [Rickettsiales bacterium]